MTINNLKIIHIFAPGPFGGAERVILTGLPALLDVNSDTTLYIIRELRVPDHANKMIDYARKNSIPYNVLDCKGRFDLKLIFTLFKMLKKQKPDIFHAHGIKAILYGYLTKAYSKSFIATHHGKTSHTAIVRVYEYIEEFILQRTNATISVSEKMFKDLKRKGLNPAISYLINNPLAITPPERIRDISDETSLLFVGRLSKEKGLIDFIEALYHVPRELKLKLVIVGDGLEKDHLIKKSKEFGLEKIVDFVGFQEEVSQFYSEADCLIMPSHREGLPMTLIEACASGLPVIASNVGGIPQLVNEENGILVQPKNKKDFSSAISSFHSNKNRYIKEARLKSIQIKDYYSPEKWAKKTLEVYYKSIKDR